MTATIPWDSYLIRTNIWSYPPDAVFGGTLFDIPYEEVFFFVIQTYNTTLLYLLLSRPVLKECNLVREDRSTPTGRRWKSIKIGGQILLSLGLKKAWDWIQEGGQKTYLGLILIWALPFLLLLWSLAYQFILNGSATTLLLPVAIPTLYLWLVDTLALRRGTWVISSGTKTGIELWPNLEIEEAIFFLLTNMLIVAGLVAFDNAVAVLNAFPAHYPTVPALPSPALLVKALLLPAGTYDDDRIQGYQQSVARLKRKSRSFYLASSTFQGRLRIDLILLYSFCRVADDLIDNANSPAEAKQWLQKLKQYLALCYAAPTKNAQGMEVDAKDRNRGPATLFTVQNFSKDAHLTLMLLPTERMEKGPLDGLLEGFEMDLKFDEKKKGTSPIKSVEDLDRYGARVAGTVAELCIQLVLYHHGKEGGDGRTLMDAGGKMGIALQYVNIARDLAVDARLRRCYVPPIWLKEVGLDQDSFITGLVKGDLDEDKVGSIRRKLLDRAFALYEDSVGAIERLPSEARGGMRVAVESYMQIGRELRKGNVRGGEKASVPAWKRIWVAWNALSGPSSR